MKTIKFRNTKGVIVAYKLGGALNRSVAFFIDVLLYYILFLILTGIFNSLFESRLISMLLGIVLFFTPFLVEVLTNGQSPGKMALGLCVVSNYGRQCTIVEYFTRHVVKLVEIGLSLGLLPITLISFAERGQSLGDLFAGTTVIVKKKSTRFSLKEISDIGTRKTYEIQYPEVKRLKEKDVLILKSLLNEHRFDKRSRSLE